MSNSVFDKEFPTFYIDDFTLREIKPLADSEGYFFYMNHPEVAEYIATGSLPTSADHAKRELQYWASLFNTRKGVYWAISQENKIIGTIGFNMISSLHRKGEISYDLNRDFWDKGIMRKSIQKILEFAKDDAKLVRVQATTIKTNTRSIKALEKNGFKYEGILRRYEFLHGKNLDSMIYSIIFDKNNV